MQISNLPASNSFSSTDVLPIEINGITYKVTGATLAAALQTLGNYLTTDNVANNLTTTAAGSVLDARQGKALADKVDATQSDIAIIIEGNQTTHTGGVAVGEYVIVRNSTISGITDGLYKATQAIPANTAITSAYLEAVDVGGLNTINNRVDNIGTITNYIYNGVNATWAGQSYNNIFENIPAGKYIVQISYASDFNSIACTGSNFNNTFADLGNRGGTFILDAQSTTTVQLYINTNDTSNHIFYRFYGKLMKIA